MSVASACDDTSSGNNNNGNSNDYNGSAFELPGEVKTLNALTFVMTIEYNGYKYAGFQRQTATSNDDNAKQSTQQPSSLSTSNDKSSSDKGTGKHKRSPGLQPQMYASTPNKTAKRQKNKNTSSSSSTAAAPITVQQQIETALKKWTSLSLAALRVRGAGRTDKGVHASGQVVAFDIPMKLLEVNDSNNIEEKHDDTGRDEDSSSIEQKETLSKYSIQLLQDANNTLSEHRSKLSNSNGAATDARTVIDQWQIRRAITTRLPPDIVLRSVRIWTGSSPFEARKEISCKTYTYKLRFRALTYLDGNESSRMSSTNNDGTMQQQQTPKEEQLHQIHPICNAGPHLLGRINDQNTVWLSQWPLNPTILRQACKMFVGEHDFINFVHKDERKKSMRHTADQRKSNDYAADATFEKNKSPHEIDLLEFSVDVQHERMEVDPTLPPVIDATFTLRAKGFHRSMVRNLVGFVVDVARGVRSLEDIPVLLFKEEPKEDSSQGNDDGKLASMVNSAPACGLCLARVQYVHDTFL